MVGIMGGTGLGEALFGGTFSEEQVIDTPFGATSGPIPTLSWAGLAVGVLACVASLPHDDSGVVALPTKLPGAPIEDEVSCCKPEDRNEPRRDGPGCGGQPQNDRA